MGWLVWCVHISDLIKEMLLGLVQFGMIVQREKVKVRRGNGGGKFEKIMDRSLGFAKQYLPRIRAQILAGLSRSEGAKPQASQSPR